MTFVKVNSLYKVFGSSPDEAFSHIGKGESKEGIKHKTGNVVALNDISFTVRKGEIFVVMGLSGSGKSTLIRCINRLIDPTRGTIEIDGKDIAGMSRSELTDFRRRKISMVFQHFGLMPNRTILRNVMLGLEMQNRAESRKKTGEEMACKARKALKLVGLEGWEESMPTELSGGMQQRVGLARALAVDTPIVLMDEPFSALDPLIKDQMQEELLRIQSKMKKTIMFITHDLHEALKIGDRIAILNEEGKIVQLDTPENIVLNPADGFVRTFVKNIDSKRVIRSKTVSSRPAAVRYDATAAEALKLMEKHRTDHVFVTDKEGSLLGAVSMPQLQGTDRPLKSLIKKTGSVKSIDVIDHAIPHLLQDDAPLAVVDEDGRLEGMITRKDISRSITGGKIGRG